MTLYDILFYMSHQLWNSFKYGFFYKYRENAVFIS